ncbi:MAG: Magnesium transporter MgtE [Syntrophorhabdus sp. PtaU1.Bin153]|nr:MAG: Magnesium transporter MgtE [Syntrophorhabdus sp. PtaU1.Bin153]
MAYITDVYLSEILNKDVVDQYGRKIGMLWDLSIVPGAEYPSVTRLILRKKRQLIEVPVESLQLFNRFVITVDLSEVKPESYAFREGDILVKRHILDKQILDVNGAKVVRVNDLKLGEGDGMVCIAGIDVGLNGILRRIDGGKLIQKTFKILNKPIRENIIGWNYLQTMDPQLRHLTLTVAKRQLGQLHPSDLAQILTDIPPEEGTEILSSVDEELAGEALHEVSTEVREKLLKEMDKETISDILEEMPPDEAADILGDMPEEKSEELLSLMEKEEAMEVKDLLGYEEDTAGGLMTSEFLDFSPDMTIDETMTDIRLLVPDVEFIYYIYVVDDDDHLLGVVTLKKLLTNPLDRTLGDLMTRNVKSVHLDAGRKEIAEMVSKYDIVALPVVDDEDKIRGIITVDDIIDLLLPNPTRRRKKR